MKRITIILLLSFIFLAFKVFAEVAYIKPSELAEQSDLIIIGTVGEIQKTNETKKDTFGRDVFIKEAKVSVEDTLKGKSTPVAIVKFAYENGEADVQDANLEEEKGKKTLLYLRLNNDPVGSYSVVSGWSGVVRFYDGKYYHQYWEVNFSEYLNKLKEFLRNQASFDKENYFPDGIFDNFVYQWYSKQLRALDELSIYKERSNKDKQLFRFTWLRTFHNPISIRLEVNKNDGSGTLYVKETDGAGGYEPGNIKEDFKKNVSKESVDKLFKLLEKEDFWKLASRVETMGLDGAQWIIEGLQDGKYHLVDRWSPNGGVKDIGLFFLQLSGLKVEDIY